MHTINSFYELLKNNNLLVESNIIDNTIQVKYITYNSKEVVKNTLFACKGVSFKDEYLLEAEKKGASLYISERKIENANISYIIVNDIRKAMALCADLFYDKPYDKLKLIGITGTKGKSTTVYYIKYILDEYLQSVARNPSAIVSTIDTYDGKSHQVSHLTTPEAIPLFEHFNNAVESDIDFFEMEVSSQALKYDRVYGVNFDVSLFLNFSEDHISPVEHCDLDDYLTSKLKIFSQSKNAVININTDFFERVYESAGQCKRVVTFGLTDNADFYGYDIKKQGHSTFFKVRCGKFDEQFELTMPGLFNVENALAAIATCDLFNIPIDIIKKGLKKARSSGRMEIYTSSNNDVITIVDYAHNKMSFEKLFQSIKQEYKDRKIISVFGCPGGKALNRRKELGEVASMYSDKIYITADHPAKENIADIIADIKQYVTVNNCSIEDRKEAIKKAILNAPHNSVVVIAGKGSETFQNVGSEHIPYKTDAYYAQKYLKQIDDKVMV